MNLQEELKKRKIKPGDKVIRVSSYKSSEEIVESVGKKYITLKGFYRNDDKIKIEDLKSVKYGTTIYPCTMDEWNYYQNQMKKTDVFIRDILKHSGMFYLTDEQMAQIEKIWKQSNDKCHTCGECKYYANSILACMCDSNEGMRANASMDACSFFVEK